MHRPDPAYWKRYRGGTLGKFWIGNGFDSEFKKLDGLKGNLSCPHWIEDRIYYLSDDSGLGRIHSCDSKGADQKTHGAGFSSEFYFRNLTSNGTMLAFQSAGDLFLFNPADDSIQKLDLNLSSDRVKGRRKTISAAAGFRNYSLQPQGDKLLIETRGKVLQFAHWGGPVSQIGREFAVRYKNPDWLPDGKRMVVVRDAGLIEELQVFTERGELLMTVSGSELPEGFGRIREIRCSPRKDEVAFANHRNELIHANLETGEAKIIYRNPYHLMESFDWSPDGRYLAFSQSLHPNQSRIAIVDCATFEIHGATRPLLEDFAPSFDPEGKYLYFISKRAFNPIYDDAIFDMTFAKARLPFLVVLKANDPVPFVKESKLPSGLAKSVPVSVPFSEVRSEIDFDGIEDRVMQFPVAEAKYNRIVGVGKKVLWSYEPVEGTVGSAASSTGSAGKEYVDCFDFETNRFEYYGTGVSDFKVRAECGLRVVRQGDQLRIMKAGDKPDEVTARDPIGQKSGMIDLSRAQVMVEPKEEWIHMYRDAWRMQKEYFWKADLCGVDWDAVYKRYEPVLQKVSCRREFSDLIWELIGELGTSHSYERGGDYRGVPVYAIGLLGADLTWNFEKNAYEIVHLVEGDRWNMEASSPLLAPGINLKPGDLLIEVAGIRLSAEMHPHSATMNLAGREAWIRFQRKGHKNIEESLIRLLRDEQPARYRDWVESRRKRVKELSGGRLGYLHIPNMVGQGFAEFHRGFLQELECEGLVVDVRYNGGGHVSQLILDRLARKPLGRDESRWLGVKSIPYETPRKTVIAVTNEYAGSDGDIFSHTFKMRKIGKLVGTRTWGGVVGIWPRNPHIDGGVTTQPEFATWFPDVEYTLENHGAEPDFVVEQPPHSIRKGEDPQLDFAIREALKDLGA
jgi:tricorn protease